MDANLHEFVEKLIKNLEELEVLRCRNTSTKPIQWLNEHGIFYGLESCPICRIVQDRQGHKFCQNCGQRLDVTARILKHGFPTQIESEETFLTSNRK